MLVSGRRTDDYREHQHNHGKYRRQSSVRLTGFFYMGARFNLVAFGQICDDRLNCLFNLYRDLWWLKRFIDVAL